MNLLIDTDPGTDDAIALLMALSPAQTEVDIVGITTVGGNARLAQTTRNTLAILEYAGRGDVPVARGASRPMRGAYPYAFDFHGPGGTSIRLPAPRARPHDVPAVEFLRSNILGSPERARPQRGERVTLLALGPLTNVARLLKRYPEVGRRLSRLVVMGAAIGVPGNVTPSAEFNIYSDPFAASVVLSSGLAMTLVDLNVSRRASIGREGIPPLRRGGAAGRLAARILSNWFKGHPDQETYDLCDPLAMAVALQPDIISTRRSRVKIETCLGERLGETTIVGPTGNVGVATGVDADRFFEMFYGMLAG